MQRYTPHRFSAAVVPGVAAGGMALVALAWGCPAALAQTLTAWQFDPVTQQLTLTLPTGVVPQATVSAAGDRLVLTVPQTQLGEVPTAATYEGPIRQIQLFPRDAAIDLVMTSAPGFSLAAQTGQPVAVVLGEQTRWTVTPQVAQAAPATPPSQATLAPGMIVELPPLPADPNLRWPYTGVGRLSISAANLMQPANLDTFNTLPDTLAIDPFNLGLPAVDHPVSVPSLAELDAAVGIALIPSPEVGPTLAASANGAAVAVTPSPAPTPGLITTLPPSDSGARPVTAAPVVPSGSPSLALAPETIATRPLTAAEAPPPAIDREVIDPEERGIAIAVTPAQPVPIPTPPHPSDGGTVVPITPAPNAAPLAGSPSLTLDPPFLTVPPASVPSPGEPVVAHAPRSAISAPVEGSEPTMAVPSLATPASPGIVIPPNLGTSPIVVAAAPEAAISFGQPLPQLGWVDPESPQWRGETTHLAPDTLIAAGHILALRYTGSTALALDPATVHQEVLVLETEIRDPVTNGIVAPAGSQLIGQFQARGDGHQWVSDMLIAPDGHRIPFVSTSEYVYNSPQLGANLALGTGLGALALTLLTGFSGVGLLGGALIGATAAVGTAPQVLVLEPNQVIYAEVMQDIHRVMPIAALPAQTEEWGTMPGSWVSPPRP